MRCIIEFIKNIHDFLIDSDRVNAELSWIKKLWYIVLLVGTSIYVFLNFSEITRFTFFWNFEGDNLIFLLWIVLLIFPLFDSFEGFGFKVHRKMKENEKLSELSANVMEQSNIASAKELEEKYKKQSKKQKK